MQRLRSSTPSHLVIGLALAAAFVAATGAEAKQARQDVCHIQGNGGILRLTVAEAAIPAHLAHGDHLPIVFWADTDGDGFGAGPAMDGCVVPDGFVENDDDCDDDASSCTSDCFTDSDDDGWADCRDRCSDADLDAWGTDTSGAVVGAGSIPVGACTTDGATPCALGPACLGPDCDDAASSCTTVCGDGDGDGRNDCRDRCLDADGDGYGADNSAAVIGAGPTPVGGCTTDGSTACEIGPACVGPDCDDTDPAVNPGATEVCNGIDDNCDTQIDEGLTFDEDNDSYTTPDSCEGSRDDCDDTDADVNPGATEVCNGIDDNCDSDVDEGLTFDDDGDGFTSIGSCEGSADDCDDTDEDVFPGATEVCNSVDDDCDGDVDEGGICGPAKRVFVSTALYDGNFGDGFGGDGLAGADAACQTLADNAGLGGTFRAWISGRPDGEVGGGGQDVADRFTQSAAPYQLVDGTQVADDWADLTDGSLDAPIDVTEVNTPVGAETRVWTNTKTNANAFDIVRDCALNAGPHTWSCDPVTVCPFESGNYGFATASGSTWTTAPSNNTGCDTMLHLYCFEQ